MPTALLDEGVVRAARLRKYEFTGALRSPNLPLAPSISSVVASYRGHKLSKCASGGGRECHSWRVKQLVYARIRITVDLFFRRITPEHPAEVSYQGRPTSRRTTGGGRTTRPRTRKNFREIPQAARARLSVTLLSFFQF